MPDATTVTSSMQASDWITLGLGAAAFVGTIWSNITAQRAVTRTGQQRIAEFRREWIEALRNDIGEFMSSTGRMLVLLEQQEKLNKLRNRNKSPSTKEIEFLDENFARFYEQSNETIVELTGRYNKLRLTLNPSEHLQAEILAALDESYSAIVTNKTVVPANRILGSTQKFLKAEWDEKVVQELK